MAGRLDGRLALISGASRGLGAALAVRFAREGAHVILTARTVGGLEETDDAVRKVGGSATLAPLDLFEADKIDMLAASIHQRFGKLDVLVSGAAQLGVLSPVHHLDPQTWDRTLSLNLTANQRLIRAFDPLLRQSDAGRALFATCEAASSPKAFWGVYAASKAGLEALVRCYAAELGNSAVEAHLIDPGPMSTKLRSNAYPGEPPGTQADPSDDAITEKFVAAAEV
jgi:NAD(P)-dependent dehydrogenase (short-subunit alcohol dehydrogenase family)